MSDISIHDVTHLGRDRSSGGRRLPKARAVDGIRRRARATMKPMPDESLDTPTPKQLEALVANGDVRAGDGTRFLAEPVRPAEGDRTAADYVAEGRR
jgi:hypothetical protein